VCDEQLFSEREHELIKKAAEELMQKKSLEDISKMISPTANKSAVESHSASQDVSGISSHDTTTELLQVRSSSQQ